MHNTLKAAIVAGLSISLAACSVPRQVRHTPVRQLYGIMKPASTEPTPSTIA